MTSNLRNLYTAYNTPVLHEHLAALADDGQGTSPLDGW